MIYRKRLSDAESLHFNTVSTLLYLIDPVRGKPIAYSLDTDPNDPTQRYDHLQRRFLDSFALVCSTSRKGAETASAVCMEQDRSGATVLRLARNRGVPDDLINRLRPILDKLMAISREGHVTLGLEDSILHDIIEITRDKIDSLLQWIGKGNTRQAVDDALKSMNNSSSHQDGSPTTGFSRWISRLPDMVALAPSAPTSELIPHIRWASRARWVYSRQFESFVSSPEGEVPLWVNTIYKLGRYYAATQAMVKLASSRPELFLSIRIEAVESPSPRKFELKDKGKDKGRKYLADLLQSLNKASDPAHLVSELGRAWFTRNEDGYSHVDPEKLFRQKCSHMLTVHAEMQLISFYDHHPELTPRLLFMGTSKKACYLCDRFLSLHPLKMAVSASHQKLWPSWMPPDPPELLRERYRHILQDMKGQMERAAKQELGNELGQRRPPNLDSTAGPAITFSSTFWTTHMASSTRAQQSLT